MSKQYEPSKSSKSPGRGHGSNRRGAAVHQRHASNTGKRKIRNLQRDIVLTMSARHQLRCEERIAFWRARI